MQVTMVSAGIIGLLIVVLGFRISLLRRKLSISMGDGGNAELAGRVRAHGNCVEWAPIGLILLFLAEQQAGAAWYVIVLAVALVGSRLLHPLGMALPGANAPRAVAALLTYLSVAILGIIVLLGGLGRCATCSLV